jgi:uncharacterized repeat protein (TIGR03803 family)
MVTSLLWRRLQSWAGRICSLAAAFVLLPLAIGLSLRMQAQTTATESTLYSFKGAADSEGPAAQLVQAADGNFYGTTYGNFFTDFGSVFNISPAGSLTTLYKFNGTTDGGTILSNVIQGSDGNFYGTAYGNLFTSGTGALFQITSSGTETTLYSFPGGSGGGNPETGLIEGSDGKYYGVSGDGSFNDGLAFSFTSSGTFTPLFTFDGLDGNTSFSGPLLQAGDGNYYGTTSTGGTNAFGEVFQLTPSGKLTVLYNFQGAGDGAAPQGALIEGNDGNFYGATGSTGAISAANGGNGTIFKITPAGVLTTLYLFTGKDDGSSPWGLVWGSDGNLYSTTLSDGANGHGTVFQMTPTGSLTTLYAFAGGTADGALPQAGLVQGSDGNFYGTAVGGGAQGDGTVFRINTTPALAAPVQVTSSTSKIDAGQSLTLTWQVLNAFSTTLQQCYAFVEGGSADTVWTGLQTGTYSSTTRLYTGSAVVTPVTSGTFTYALTCGGMESGSTTVVVGSTPTLLISTTSLASGMVGTGYLQTLGATGGIPPYTWSVAAGSLPPGLTLLPSTGAISGTPTTSGTDSFMVQVADSATTPSKATATLSIKIVPQPPAVTTATLPNGLVNSAYSTTLEATNGVPPYTWSLSSGNLPAGLSLAPSTGVISGTPTVAQTSSFTVKVSDSETVPETGVATLSLTINPQLRPVGLVTVSPATLVAGQSATASVTVSPPLGSIVPTGTVQFQSNGVNLGSPVTLQNGTATLPGQVFSATGTFAITADYSGDTLYLAVDFAPANLTVSAAPLPSITANPATISVASGGTGTATLTAANFSTHSITFTCAGLPADAACSFGALSSSNTSLLTVTTNDTIAGSREHGTGSLALYAIALPGLIAVVGLFRKRKRSSRWLLLLLLLPVGIGMTACNSGSNVSTDTPAGTSTFTVTATGGGQTATVSMNLTVE